MQWFLPLSVLLLALPGPAHAQFAAPPPRAPAASRPPPPALPGLAARPAPEPIPANPNANLSPTAALFDAINRGDLAAARDAVARGASLEERNVLGLTAIESAVDQGRNDILFYLLSARAALRAQQPADSGLTAAQRAARDRAAEREATRAARAAAEAARAQPSRVGPAPSLRPRLFANDGGAPRPEIGFLGFDAGRGDATPRTRGG
jgi:ankyrin repeat protein